MNTWYSIKKDGNSLIIQFQENDNKSMYVIPKENISHMRFTNFSLVYAVEFSEEMNEYEPIEPTIEKRREAYLVLKGTIDSICMPFIVGQALYKFLKKEGVF